MSVPLTLSILCAKKTWLYTTILLRTGKKEGCLPVTGILLQGSIRLQYR